MPEYEYKCPLHGKWTSPDRADKRPCPVVMAEDEDRHGEVQYIKCKLDSKRVWGFSLKPIMHSHFNPAVSEVVSGEKGLDEAFKRKSEAVTLERHERNLAAKAEMEAAAESLGMGDPHIAEPTMVEHRFKRVDLRDKDQVGITDEGLDATHKRKRDSGESAGKFYG